MMGMDVDGINNVSKSLESMAGVGGAPSGQVTTATAATQQRMSSMRGHTYDPPTTDRKNTGGGRTATDRLRLPYQPQGAPTPEKQAKQSAAEMLSPIRAVNYDDVADSGFSMGAKVIPGTTSVAIGEVMAQITIEPCNLTREEANTVHASTVKLEASTPDTHVLVLRISTSSKSARDKLFALGGKVIVLSCSTYYEVGPDGESEKVTQFKTILEPMDIVELYAKEQQGDINIEKRVLIIIINQTKRTSTSLPSPAQTQPCQPALPSPHRMTDERKEALSAATKVEQFKFETTCARNKVDINLVASAIIIAAMVWCKIALSLIHARPKEEWSQANGEYITGKYTGKVAFIFVGKARNPRMIKRLQACPSTIKVKTTGGSTYTMSSVRAFVNNKAVGEVDFKRFDLLACDLCGFAVIETKCSEHCMRQSSRASQKRKKDNESGATEKRRAQKAAEIEWGMGEEDLPLTLDEAMEVCPFQPRPHRARHSRPNHRSVTHNMTDPEPIPPLDAGCDQTHLHTQARSRRRPRGVQGDRWRPTDFDQHHRRGLQGGGRAAPAAGGQGALPEGLQRPPVHRDQGQQEGPVPIAVAQEHRCRAGEGEPERGRRLQEQAGDRGREDAPGHREARGVGIIAVDGAGHTAPRQSHSNGRASEATAAQKARHKARAEQQAGSDCIMEDTGGGGSEG